MKYIKKFELFDEFDNISVGYYVVLRDDIIVAEFYRYFLGSVCKVVGFDNLRNVTGNIKLECGKERVWFYKTDIEYYSKNKDDAESYLKSKKYNL